MPEIKEPSLTHRIVAIIGGTASFVITVWIFFTLFSLKAEPNIAVVMSVISGIMVGWIVLSLSGVLKQFSLKSPFFEMTANIEKKVDEIKTEAKDLKNDVSKINQRIDTVITNQISNNQSQSVQIINGIENERQNIVREIDQQMKKYIDKGIMSSEKEIKIPESFQKKLDLLIAKEKTFEQLLNKFSKQVTLNVGSTLKKANYFYTKGEYEEAEKLYKMILEEVEDPDALFNLALCASKIDRPKQAISYYKQFLKVIPDNEQAYSNMSNAYILNGQYTEGLESAKKAIDINKKYSFAWYNKSCACALLNNKKDSLDALTKAIEMNSKFKEMAKTDKDFNNIKDELEFQKLIES